jgi:alpha-1,3-glucosyltransferase
LLFENQEYPIKVLLLLTYGVLMWVGFLSHFAENSARDGKKVNGSGSLVKKKFIGWISLGYLLGMFAIELWSRVFHHYVFGNRLPFLPLMMVSVYCAVGMMYSWMWQLSWIVRYT